MSQQLREEVESIPGFLKFENWINEEGYSVSLSYWETLASLEKWKMYPKHQEAKERAKWDWYKEYSIEVCEICTSYASMEP